MIIQFLTGIGILLFGVNTMSSSFEKILGNKIRKLVSKYSKSPIKNTLFGILLDLVMQSSTASVSLVMGLSGVGIVTLFQAFCIIIGTNIASAINVFWVALQGVNIIAYFGLLTLVGIFIRLFGKSNTAKNWGKCLCGLGLIFVGLGLMSSATSALSQTPGFIEFFFKINNPIVLFFLGLLLSAVLNSSLGTVAILSSILSMSYPVLSLQNASYVIYAMNIGTTFTLLLIGLTSKNRQSLKTALSYLTFNVIGALIFCPLTIFDWVTPVTSFLNNLTLQIIFINLIFNIVTSVISLILAKPISKLLNKMIKDKETKQVHEISQMPTLGLVQLNSNAITYFYETCQTLESAMLYVSNLENNDNLSIKSKISELTQNAKDMNNSLLQLGGELIEEDEVTKRYLNSTFVGIEKTNVNINKLINSCVYNDKKVNFTQKHIKTINEIKDIISENLIDMKVIVNETLTQGVLTSKELLNNIISRLEKVVELKIKAKKSIVHDTASMEQKIKKYTCYLNVINYFEQINTNLTDIILSISSINAPENLEEKVMEI